MKNSMRSRLKVDPPTAPAADLEALAIQALTFIGGDRDHLDRFLISSGLSPDALRHAARDPTFLHGVMDYIVADEPLLLAFAASAGMRPEDVARAHARLARDGVEEAW